MTYFDRPRIAGRVMRGLKDGSDNVETVLKAKKVYVFDRQYAIERNPGCPGVESGLNRFWRKHGGLGPVSSSSSGPD